MRREEDFVFLIEKGMSYLRIVNYSLTPTKSSFFLCPSFLTISSLHKSRAEMAMMKSEGDILTAVLPLLKLLTVTLIGLILAHSRTQLVPRSTFRLLSKLVFVLFLPCLIFTHLGSSITFTNFLQWWFIPVNTLLSTLLGFFLGYLVALICRPPPQYFRFTIIVTAFGNTGNLPLAIISSVCHSTTDNPFGPDCYRTGVAYVSFSQWLSVLLVYTVVYHMMEPPLEFYEVVEKLESDDDDDGRDAIDNDLSRPLLVEAEWPGMEEKETEHCKTPFIARLFRGVSEISHNTIPDDEDDSLEHGGGPSPTTPNSPKSIRCLVEPKVVRKIRIVAETTPIRHILQPPTIASLLAIIIGTVPTLNNLCFGDDAPLSFITDSFDILAGAMVPSAMLVLGGMLAEGPNESKLGTRTTIGITVARLLVLPMLGIGVVVLADRWNFLVQGDQLYRFVLLLQYTTPTAILLGAIASLRGYGVREASSLLFWQHVCAVLSLPLYIFVYFRLLLSYT